MITPKTIIATGMFGPIAAYSAMRKAMPGRVMIESEMKSVTRSTLPR
jgi:hypothetical protein